MREHDSAIIDLHPTDISKELTKALSDYINEAISWWMDEGLKSEWRSLEKNESGEWCFALYFSTEQDLKIQHSIWGIVDRFVVTDETPIDRQELAALFRRCADKLEILE